METYTRDEIDKLNQILTKITEDDGDVKDIPDEFLRITIERIFSIQEEEPFDEERTTALIEEIADYLMPRVKPEDFSYALQSGYFSELLVTSNNVAKNYDRFCQMIPFLIEQQSLEALNRFWGLMEAKEQRKFLFEVVQKRKDSQGFWVQGIWGQTKPEVQLEQEMLHPGLFRDVIQAMNKRADWIYRLFEHTSKDLRERSVDELVYILTEISGKKDYTSNDYLVEEIVKEIEDSKMQEEVFRALAVKDDISVSSLLAIWRVLREEKMQQDLLPLLLNRDFNEYELDQILKTVWRNRGTEKKIRSIEVFNFSQSAIGKSTIFSIDARGNRLS